MRTVILALLILGLAATASASWTCYKDANGNTQCYGDDGALTCYTDAQGDQHCYRR